MSPSPKELRSRWVGEEERVKAIIDSIKNGDGDWTAYLLNGPSSTNRRPIALLGVGARPRKDSDCAPRDMRGIYLRDVDLTCSSGLADTDLDFAILENVALGEAHLTGSRFFHVAFRGSSTLTKVKARHSSFENATCCGISLNGADLSHSNLYGCDFEDADLRDTVLTKAHFNQEGALGRIHIGRRWTKFGGQFQAMEDLDPNASKRLRKYIAGSSAVRDLKREHRWLALAWYLIANYGRSAGRLALNTLGCWLFFSLCFLDRVFLVGGKPSHLGFSDAFYLSIVTLTTLGYGDIVPAGEDWWARLLVGAEALSGIVLIGALISILIENATLNTD